MALFDCPIARMKSWSFAVKNHSRPASRSWSSKLAVIGWVAPSRAPSMPSIINELDSSALQNLSSISRSSAITYSTDFRVENDGRARGVPIFGQGEG